MRTVIARIGATGAGALLALGLLAGPSAAKDSDQNSSAEKARESNKVTCFQPDGGNNTQGRSLSDPDGDTNGGADKPDPDCTGGVDATDRDGNNGCGNDADREDDNNGNCDGDGTAAGEPDQPENGDDVTVNPETVEGDVNVQSAAAASESGTPATEASSTNAADPAAVTAADNAAPAADTTTPETQVLGETLTAPDALPRTGAAVGGLALLGGLLVGGGRLTVLARKLLRIG